MSMTRNFSFAFAFLGLAVAASNCTLIVGTFEGPGGTGGGNTGPMCMSPMDCPPPANACVQATCTDGQCGTQFLAVGDNFTPSTAHDCKATQCDGNGNIAHVLDTKNVPIPSNPCLVGTCDASGNPGQANAPSRTMCSTMTVMNGLCDGMANCVQCLMTSDCPMGEACSPANNCLTMGCMDMVQDGMETDVDCGGSGAGHCDPCGDGKHCLMGTDCKSLVCTGGKCQTATCMDGVQNNSETDVDCGGGTCAKCGPGLKCKVDADCVGGQCDPNSMTCTPDCSDGVTNNNETDTDCGGGPFMGAPACPACAVMKKCKVDTDCASQACDAVTHICVTDQCQDHQQDGNETDKDCGGSCGATCKVGQMCKTAADCVTAACDSMLLTCTSTTCSDHIQDNGETDVDCGGPACMGCPNGEKCVVNTDCASGACNFGPTPHTCVASQCSDNHQDGAETDIDCGGGVCPTCGSGKGCNVDNDCTSPLACDLVTMKCTSQCSDQKQDGLETDVDCGGGTCTQCALNKKCQVNNDCLSSACDYGPSPHLCVSSTCVDHHKDGLETDIDCGGGTCPSCANGGQCLVNSDCMSNVCNFLTNPHTCGTNPCMDGQKDGTETDVDCGGSCPAKCALGKNCTMDSDCASNACDFNLHVCDMSQCMDGFKDGNETDTDCGGGMCGGCAAGLHCVVNTDCLSGFCDNVTTTCATSHCTDQKLDSGETDVDCGGSVGCPTCGVGLHCIVNSDCSTNACDNMTTTCAMNQCVDQHQDGAETGVDCGGGTCPKCGIGSGCNADSDCASGACSLCSTPHTCTGSTCSDCQTDNGESDVDCGAACPGQCCAAGKHCNVNGDCCPGHTCNSSKLCQ